MRPLVAVLLALALAAAPVAARAEHTSVSYTFRNQVDATRITC